MIVGAFVLDIPRIIGADGGCISAAFFLSVGAGIGEDIIDAALGIVADLSARAGLRDEDVIFANGIGIIVTSWILCRVAGGYLADAGITARAGLCDDDAICTDLQMVFVYALRDGQRLAAVEGLGLVACGKPGDRKKGYQKEKLIS